MSSAQEFSARLIAGLCELGVKSFYLAPGSRSQSLAIAANQLAKAGLVDLTVRLDERSMGFLALGRAMAGNRPVALITTSGTAVANLHPAVLEAHHSGVPLILLTADRPARLRGLGANQTTNQVGIFADALRDMIDVSVPELEEFDAKTLAEKAVAAALGVRNDSTAGPVQLNLQFQEPLSSAKPDASEFVIFKSALPEVEISESQLEIAVSQNAVVVAGSSAGSSAVEFAARANLPLFAEPSSRARFGEHAISNYPSLLATEIGEKVDQVFVFGKPTLARSVLKLISRTEVWVQRSREHGNFDVFQNSRGFADRLIPIGSAPDTWLASWQKVSSEPSHRAKLATAVWNATKAGEQLLFGASQIIRDAETALPPKEIEVFANRGLAGIDGTVATALGLAQNGKKTRALIGDLTLVHDASSLNVSGLENLDVQVIVGNDNGGQIFKNLEVASQIEKEDLSRLFTTPQQVDLENLAAAYGWNYKKIASIGELEGSLVLSGLWLIDYQL